MILTINSSEITFFFGAGASVPAGLRTVVQLTDYFKDHWLKVKSPNLSYLEFVELIIKIIKNFRSNESQNIGSNEEYKVDIESLLETIEIKLNINSISIS